MPAAAYLEQALLENLEVIGFNLDRKKCFDNFDAIMTCAVMDALRAHFRLINGLLAKYRAHERRIKMNNAISEPFPSTSLIQGCALSLMKCNSLFSILSLYNKKHSPNVSSQFFVDNNKLRTLLRYIEQLDCALKANKRFDELTGQMMSEKYVAWGTSNKPRKAVIGIANNFRSLGYFVCTSRKIAQNSCQSKML